MFFFTLFNIIFKWSIQDKQLSRTVPKCLCELVSNTLLLLKLRGEWRFFFCFSTKYYFLRLFARIRIKIIAIGKPIY